MKEILIVINTMGRAGAEKSLISLLRSFDYQRVSVSLLSIINRGEMFAEVPAEVNIINNNYTVSPILGTEGSFYIAKQVIRKLIHRFYFFKFFPYAIKNIFWQLKLNKRFQSDKLLWKLLADNAPAIDKEFDLCIAFIEGASTYYAIDKVKADKKCVFIHVDYEKAGYIPVFDLKYYYKADKIFCISESVRKAFLSVFPFYDSDTKLFPNIIHPDEILANSLQGEGFGDNFNGIRLLTVGRLHPQKGYDIAIPAFADLVRLGYDNVRWYVIGDGNEKARLLRLIEKYRLNDNFILLGSRENPLPYVRTADIYVQPSRFEGFPLTLQEALILNKPCLTTDFEGVMDVLEDGKNAIIIELTKRNITEALIKLISDADLRRRIVDGTKEIELEFPDHTSLIYELLGN